MLAGVSQPRCWQAAGLRPAIIRRRTYKQRLLLSLVCGTVGRGGIGQLAWSSEAGGRVAIYHLRAQVIARSAGRSAVAAAAYRHRTRMLDERTGTDHRFDRNEIVAHAEMALPAQTPAWLRTLLAGRAPDRASEALWNRVEAEERTAHAQLAREIVIALPTELTRAQNIALMQDYVAAAFSSRRQVADWVYHDKAGNPHGHIMLTLRPLTEAGFGRKTSVHVDANGVRQVRTWAGDRDSLRGWRAAWAETANRHLARAGFETRIDHRSFRAQGIALTPSIHLGPAGNAIRLKAGTADRSLEVNRVRAENARGIEAEPERLIALLTHEKSVFDDRDVARAIFRYVDDPDQFERIRLKVLQSDELVMLVPDLRDPDSGRRVTQLLYTSREMLGIERAMAQRAIRLAARRDHDVRPAFVARALAVEDQIIRDQSQGRFGFSEEQKEAVRYLTGDERIRAVVGLAGAGKSTLLAAARRAWEADRYTIHGAALAGKAAEALERSSGIKARTLASWELAWSQGRDRLGRDDVFVIDEAGMVPSRQLARVLAEVETRAAKIVLVGDAMQLQPIEAGAAFWAGAGGGGYVVLQGIRRQYEAWAQAASLVLARGQAGEALRAYDAHGAVRFRANGEETRAALIADWMAARASGSSLILAHRNRDVWALNAGVREALQAAGALAAGEPFRTARGDRAFAAGDRILFLKNDRALGVKNGMIGTVAQAGRGRIEVRLDGNRTVVVEEEGAYPHVDHGYAVTIHKAQGTTVDRAFVLASPSMDQHLAYVALSRHRESAVLYAARDELGDLVHLAERLGRSGAKTTTLDFEDRAEFLERRGFESARTLAFVSDVWERQRAWIGEQRERLSELWERAGMALHRVRERWAGRTLEAGVEEPPTALARASSAAELARASALSSPDYQYAAAITRVAAARVYEDFEGAAHTIEAVIGLGGAAADQAWRRLQADPAQFGLLRDRPDRADAVAALAAAVRDQTQTFGVAYDAALAQVRPIVRALDAPPALEVAHDAPSRTPLFAAVTTFTHSVEADAHAAVLAQLVHQALRAALAQ